MARDTPAPVEETTSAVRPPQDSPLSELLAREPSRVTRRFLYFMLFLFIAALIAASVLEIDVTVSAPAILQPSGKTLIVQPEIAGTVVEVYVREGDVVRAGQTLAVLESEKAGEQLAALADASQKLKNAERTLNIVIRAAKQQAKDEVENLQQQIGHLRGEREQFLRKQGQEKRVYELLKEGYREQEQKFNETDRRNEVAIKFAIENVTYKKRQSDTFDRAFQQQALGRLDMLNARREVSEAQTALDTAMSQQREGRNDRTFAEKTFRREEQLHFQRLAELDQMMQRNSFENNTAQLSILKTQGEARIKEIDANTAEQSARFDVRLARRKAEMVRSANNREMVRAVAEGDDLGAVAPKVLVVAPVAGRIGTVPIRKQGEAVERGQTLFTLLPEGPLVAEVRIANRDVGLVKVDQRLKLKLDAFPYAEFGSIKGVLVNVPPEAEGLDKPAESFYRATASLEAQTVRRDGLHVSLLAGMTATAEIVTERKTLLQLALTPLLEPFQD